MNLNFRKLHRKIAPILFLPLLASALTGIFYRLGRSWLGIPDAVAETLMVIHQGEYLGIPLMQIYVLLVGLGLLGMVVTGLVLQRASQPPKAQETTWNNRKIHRILAPLFFLPLGITALTGVIYRLGKSWFGMSNKQAAIFLRIHQGSYLGPFFKAVYVLLIGIGLIALLVTGIYMTGIFRQRHRPSKT